MKIADLKKDIILNAGVRHFDYTASGLGLESVEREIKKVMQSYANTHSDSCVNSFKTQKFYENARTYIKKSLNLSEDFVLIACGTGSSGAIKKFQEILGIYAPPRLKAKYLTQIPKKSLPLVIIGPYEHHSIELSFRAGLCECVRIGLCKNGEIDFDEFQSIIKAARKADKTRQIIAAFSLASNVTGIISDYKRLWRIAKAHDALVAFDGAALLPYSNVKCEFYDALFISPHKFIGGIGSCGLLVVRKSLLGKLPTFAAGGVVGYVSRTSAEFVCDIEKLEEAGTPGILQLIRAGAAFKIRDKIGLKTIKEKENLLKNYFFEKADKFNDKFAHEFFKKSNLNKNSSQIQGENLAKISAKKSEKILIIYAANLKNRLPIFALNIKGISPFDLAFELSKRYKIETRAGCACAGPYGHDLLNLKDNENLKTNLKQNLSENSLPEKIATNSGKISQANLAKNDLIFDEKFEFQRPAWLRVSLHYTHEFSDVDYFFEALKKCVKRLKK